MSTPAQMYKSPPDEPAYLRIVVGNVRIRGILDGRPLVKNLDQSAELDHSSSVRGRGETYSHHDRRPLVLSLWSAVAGQAGSGLAYARGPSTQVAVTGPLIVVSTPKFVPGTSTALGFVLPASVPEAVL